MEQVIFHWPFQLQAATLPLIWQLVVRWQSRRILLILALASFISYVLRTNLSFAAPEMMGDLGLDEELGRLDRVRMIAVRLHARERAGGDDLELALGVEVDERGIIAVDKQMRTNVPHIFAIGDVVGQPMLAHKGSHEGIVAAERIAGVAHHPMRYDNIPSVGYCHPEVATIGLTEEEAKEAGHEVKVGKYPLTAHGRGRCRTPGGSGRLPRRPGPGARSPQGRRQRRAAHCRVWSKESGLARRGNGL